MTPPDSQERRKKEAEQHGSPTPPRRETPRHPSKHGLRRLACWLGAACILVEVAPVVAQPAFPAAELDTYSITTGRLPLDLLALDDHVYLAAFQSDHGSELWRTDGTASGTELFRDLWPGPPSSQVQLLLAADGILYVAADDGVHGGELWRTDGTRRGTWMLGDLCPGACTSLISFHSRATVVPAVLGNRILFEAWEPIHGLSLWSSDGTPAGTTRVRTTCGYDCYLDHRLYETVGDKVFFTTPAVYAGGPADNRLWVTDGTEGGTQPLDLCPTCTRGIEQMVAFDERLFFFTRDQDHGEELWVTDGTEEGTRLFADLRPGPESFKIEKLLVAGDFLLLQTRSCPSPAECVWRTDGTPAGTRPFTELLPADTSQSVRLLYQADSRLFYASWSSAGGDERTLWMYELSTETRRQLASGVEPSYPGPSSQIAGRHLFPARTAQHGTELWVSDGTAEGTRLLADISPGAESSSPEYLTVLDGAVLFTAWPAPDHGPELWRSDGTPQGTFRVDPSVPSVTESRPEELVAWENRLLFRSWTAWSSIATAAWVIDPSQPAATRLTPGGFVRNFTPIGDGLLLFTDDGERRPFNLYLSDGTSRGTLPLAQSDHRRWFFTPVGENVFFVTLGAGQELWITDGTTLGTRLVENLNPGWSSSGCRPYVRTCETSPSNFPRELTPLGEKLLLVGYGPDRTSRLWASDGTEAGTVTLKSFAGEYRQAPSELTAVGGQLFLAAFEEATGRELWASDGTADGTRLVVDLVPGAGDSDPRGLTAWCGRLYFFAATGDDGGDELWRSDGTFGGTQRVAGLALDGVPSRGLKMTAGRSRLFLTVDNPATGEELWVSEGTTGRTVLVGDLQPGPVGSYPQALTPVDDHLLFAADDGLHGLEPWISDGSRRGTRLLHDLNPGLPASGPSELTQVGERIYFAASDGISGRELFFLPRPWATGATCGSHPDSPCLTRPRLPRPPPLCPEP